MTSPVKHSPHTATRRRNGLTDQARRDAAARLRSQEIRALVEAELAPIVDAITAKVAGDEPHRRGYAFEGAIALERLLAGVVDLSGITRAQVAKMASPTGVAQFPHVVGRVVPKAA